MGHPSIGLDKIQLNIEQTYVCHLLKGKGFTKGYLLKYENVAFSLLFILELATPQKST